MQAQLGLSRTMRSVMLAVVLLVAPAQAMGVALAQGGAWIGVIPSELEIPVDGTGTTEIKVGDVSSLYGVEFHLAFDSDCVQVSGDADSATPGIQIELGALLTGGNAFVAVNEVSNADGTIDFAATLKHPAMPITGGGALARITWTATCESALTLSGTKLGDVNGLAISHATRSGKITIAPTPAPKVYGFVLLQGRKHYEGTEVFLTEEACPVAITRLSAQAIPGVPSAKTAENGYFEIVPYTGRTYLCLSAFRHGYLVGQKSLPLVHPPGDAGTVTLLAGDVNQDDVINIFDLAIIASHYGSSDEVADVNGDGTVDIYDLSLAAGNFGHRGPIVW